ncbi:MAG: hypothetical protein H0W08_22865, partial [Acidobacteria bacterium]|nr:hypothetical protein [Acidobacteriota bacterium]
MSKKKAVRKVTRPVPAAASSTPPWPTAVLRPAVFTGILTAIVATGALLRVLAAGGELWLDEIWSFRLAHLLTTPAGVFTALHHDNNHHLNSLYLYFVRESPVWIRYRLHTLAAGVGTMIVACVIARREADRRTVLGVALLTSGSFLLTLYASEARGYALAVFFSFMAVPCAARFLESGRVWWAAAYALAAVLGLLSHLTFLHALLGLLAWTAYRALRYRGRRPPIWSLTLLHAFPLAALAALYWIDLRHVIVGGGPMLSISEVTARIASLVVGGPEEGPWRGAAAAAAAIAWVASIIAVRRAGSDLWVLFVLTGAVAPILTLALADSSLLFERYFLVPAAFVTLAYGWLIAAIARRSLWIAAALIGAYLVCNGTHTVRLIEFGRGSYLAALRHIDERSTQRPVT